MRLRVKRLLLLLTGICLAAWTAARFLDTLDEQSNRSSLAHPRSHTPPFPDDSSNNIHWFLQISDLHISVFWDPARVSELRKFCSQTVDIIKPEVVLVTGDLTDAKEQDKQGSRQFQWEWEQYDNVLQETGVLDKTLWLDIRGNHDAFDVPTLTHKSNLYRRYSPQGRQELPHSYKYTHKTTSGNYSFIGVDACPDPGPKRPFNFFGIADQATVDLVSEFSAASKSSNMTVWFGHYPLSTVFSPSQGLQKLVYEGAVYMCGHLHQLGGLARSMYTMHNTGSLELELGDWKDNRIVRLFAMDHDLFSFVDEVHGTWPMILITNPKNGQFNMALHEPTGRMQHSTHIRILAFSPGRIEKIEVFIDGDFYGVAHRSKGPLFVLPWKPADYLTGVHTIQARVKDSLGNDRSVEQQFTLDNTKIPFGLLARYILMAPHALVSRLLCFCTFAAAILPLMFTRLFRRKTQSLITWCTCGSASRWIGLWIEKVNILTLDDGLYYTLIAFNIYIVAGPWFVGNILEDEVGVCFAFGLYVKGTFLPGSLTFVYAGIQYILFNIPLTLCLAHSCHRRQLAARKSEKHRYQLNDLKHDIPLILTLINQIYFAYGGIYLTYGSTALFVGPVRTWSIFLAIVLRYWVSKTAISRDASATPSTAPKHEHVNGIQ